MSQAQQNNVEVTVVAGVDGPDRITLQLGDSSETSTLSLTPSQARLLATELIGAVNRAEVKASLKSNSNMWSRGSGSRSRLAAAN